jgi:hypothetical protein
MAAASCRISTAHTGRTASLFRSSALHTAPRASTRRRCARPALRWKVTASSSLGPTTRASASSGAILPSPPPSGLHPLLSSASTSGTPRPSSPSWPAMGRATWSWPGRTFGDNSKPRGEPATSTQRECDGNATPVTCQASVKVNSDTRTPAHPQRKPAIARRGNNVVVVWEDGREQGPNFPRIYASVSNDGGATWGTDMRVNRRLDGSDPGPTDGATSPSVAYDDNGRIWVAWEHRSGSPTAQADIYVAYWDGTTWSTPLAGGQGAAPDAQPGALASLSSGARRSSSGRITATARPTRTSTQRSGTGTPTSGMSTSLCSSAARRPRPQSQPWTGSGPFWHLARRARRLS